jgi:hypothetical protein
LASQRGLSGTASIASCSWQGRALPDHGEVWSMAWNLDKAMLKLGVLKTSVRLPISPFEMERSITLEGNEARLAYRLTNLGAQEEQYVWSFHPLLQLQAGDEFKSPATTRARLNGSIWMDAIDIAMPEKGCEKIFAQPISEGLAGIRNRATGSALEILWNTMENDTLGLWLSGAAGMATTILPSSQPMPPATTWPSRLGRGVAAKCPPQPR